MFGTKRKPPVEIEAPAKRRYGLTCGELNAAIAAALDGLDHCSTRRTLEALWDLTNDAPDDAVVTLDGAVPVTCAQLDDALHDAKGFGVPAATLGALKQVRELLNRAEEKQARVAGQMVTRAEFDGLADAVAVALVAIADLLHDPRAGKLDVRLGAAARAEEFKSAAGEIQALLGRIEKARGADGQRQRRQASGRLNVVNGGNGCNF